jgi:hypothetical protein
MYTVRLDLAEAWHSNATSCLDVFIEFFNATLSCSAQRNKSNETVEDISELSMHVAVRRRLKRCLYDRDVSAGNGEATANNPRGKTVQEENRHMSTKNKADKLPMQQWIFSYFKRLSTARSCPAISEQATTISMTKPSQPRIVATTPFADSCTIAGLLQIGARRSASDILPKYMQYLDRVAKKECPEDLPDDGEALSYYNKLSQFRKKDFRSFLDFKQDTTVKPAQTVKAHVDHIVATYSREDVFTYLFQLLSS